MTKANGTPRRAPRGIPTLVHGVEMRSRLEATWAHFFDVLHWEWEYEPFDLDGYIPDFALKFPDRMFLVEVKPFFTLPELATQITRIRDAGWEGPALAVGASPLVKTSVGKSALGVFDAEECWTDDTPAEWAWCVDCEMSFYTDAGQWRCAKCAQPSAHSKNPSHPHKVIYQEGPAGLSGHLWRESGKLDAGVNWLWGEAKNRAKWRGPGRG